MNFPKWLVSLINWWNNVEHEIINKYGWVPDRPDARDHEYVSDIMPVQVIPEGIDLRPMMPPIYNQGALGSCTGNGIAAIFQYMLKKLGLPDWFPSRLFIYFQERQMEGTISSDSGAMIRDGIKSVNQVGVCNEILWPYDINKFTWKPSAIAYADALKHKALIYRKVFNNRAESIKNSLANGIPVVFGFAVYSSFESQWLVKGVMPMPNIKTERILGGHCVVICGYLPVGALVPGKRHYIIRNSWGTQWGDNGYFYMPEEFITNPNLCSDFWAIWSET